MANPEIRVKQTLDNTLFKRGLKDSQTATQKLGDQMRQIGGIVAAAFAIRAIASFTKNSMAAYEMQQKAEAKVAQAVKATGAAAGYTSEQLKKMAAQLQKVTNFGDEQILNDVTAQLLSFPQITGEAFALAQKRALDLATLIDGDLKSSTIALGKALADPLTGLTALRRMGVLFSDEQQKHIKNLVSQNKLQQAQLMILGEIENQYGGQAEAGVRALDQLRNAWGDFQEQIFATGGADKAGGLFGWMKESIEYMTWGLAEIKKNGNSFLEWWDWFWQTGKYTTEKYKEYLDLQKILEGTDEMLAQAYKDAEKWAGKATGKTEEQIVTLGDLKEQLKGLQEQRDEVSLSEVGAINIEIAALQEKIKKYEDLGDKLKELSEAQKQIAAYDSSSLAGVSMPQAALPTQPAEDPLYEMEYYIDGLKILAEEEGLILEQRTAEWDTFNEGMITMFNETVAVIQEQAQAMQAVLNVAFSGIIDAFFQLAEGGKTFGEAMEDLLKSLLRTVLQIIAAKLAESIANSFAAGTEKAGAIGGVVEGAAAAAAFVSLVPALAEGGIAYGPTLGLMGEYPGAKANPEVIAPLDKLKSIIGGNGGPIEIVGMVKGEDIYYVMKKQESKQARYGG